jgi:hypothetical protein
MANVYKVPFVQFGMGPQPREMFGEAYLQVPQPGTPFDNNRLVSFTQCDVLNSTLRYMRASSRAPPTRAESTKKAPRPNRLEEVQHPLTSHNDLACRWI